MDNIIKLIMILAAMGFATLSALQAYKSLILNPQTQSKRIDNLRFLAIINLLSAIIVGLLVKIIFYP